MNNAPPLPGDVERRPPLGEIAMFTTALVLGILLMGLQLWLLTIALDLYLAGRGTSLWLLAIISGLIFLGGLFILRILDRRPLSLRELPPNH